MKTLLLQDDPVGLENPVQLLKSLDWKERRCFSSLLTDLGFVSAHFADQLIDSGPATVTQESSYTGDQCTPVKAL